MVRAAHDLMRLALTTSSSGADRESASGPAPALPPRLAGVDVPGLYVHVPFCFHKCHYCDFYSITRQTPQRMKRFVDLLLAEAAGWSAEARGPRLRPTSIFIGGGTPSLLPIEQMSRLLSGLRQCFDLSAVEEWTVECNPATVTLDYCRMVRGMGVDRLSFGAQSFVPAELRMLERHHEPQDVPRSLEVARQAGFTRLNLDLIFAIPGQDMASWRQSLHHAVSLGTGHLSCYALTYEPNTPLAVRRRLGQVRAVEEELELDMLHETRRRLSEAGFVAYEISNFAKPGEECRHNLLYWEGGNYIGLGPSAASHIEGWRWRNRPHLGEWERALEARQMPTMDVEHLTPRRRAGELVMLQLRLARGVVFTDVARRSGIHIAEEFAAVIERLMGLGLIQVREDGFGLSEKGLNVADAVAGEFLTPAG